MPAPKTANGLQVEMRFTLFGEPVENVYHLISASETPIGEEMTTVAAEFAAWWAEDCVGSFVTGIALREVYVVDLTAADGPTYSYTPVAPIPGVHPGPALPNNCALVATKRTNQRGRSYRGRTYFAGIPETVVTNSVADAGYVADLNTDCQALLTRLSDIFVNLGVLSKAINKAWRPVGVITPVTTFALRNGRIDSQRERLPA